MTTITMEKHILKRLDALEDFAKEIRAALAAPATAPEQQEPGECWPTHIMRQWDAMRDLIAKGDKSSLPRDWFESLAEMRLIDAPTTAWHVAPTVPGLWLNSVFMKVEDVEQWHIDCQLHLECARWFGPIPPDGDKP